MAKLLVPDELWAIVEPLPPRHEPSPKGGHPRVPDRVCLTGILFVLRTGLPWEDFPHEMGCSGMTLWNRLHEWVRAGVWSALHRTLLAEFRGADLIDFSRVAVDSAHVRAVHGGKKPGPSPVGRRKDGSKHHLATEAGGVPVAATLTGANRHDVTQLLPLVDAIPPVAGKVGAPLRKPKLVMGDRAYDSDPHRLRLSGWDIRTAIARRRTPHGSRLGTRRYVVERSIVGLHQYRRMRTRFERRADVHEALMSAAMSMMCWRRLHNSTG